MRTPSWKWQSSLVCMGAVAASLLVSCSDGGGDSGSQQSVPQPKYSVEIRRTTFGIPHIKAANYGSIGYGVGYSYTQDNACLLADNILSVSGERSKFLGPNNTNLIAFTSISNLKSDFFFKNYINTESLRQAYTSGTPEVLALMEGFAAGYNRYLREVGGAAGFPAPCRGAAFIRPMTVDDALRLIAEKAVTASGGNFATQIVDAVPPTASKSGAAAEPMADDETIRKILRPDDLWRGSNLYAFGKDVTENGSGMLLGNPHFPWATTYRFYQMHLTIPGELDVMGAALGGSPVVQIGFNKTMAWTHTNDTALHFTPYELALAPDNPKAYVFDGRVIPMTEKTVTVDVLGDDGKITQVSRTFYGTQFGSMLAYPQLGFNWTTTKAFALRDANLPNTRLIEQWLRINKARNVEEVRQALWDVFGNPWTNTAAADAQGNALYADITPTPAVALADLAACTTSPTAQAVGRAAGLPVLDGSLRRCEWNADANPRQSGILGPSGMPSIIRTDYVTNSNDSYWLSNPNAPLTGFSPLIGDEGRARTLRTRVGLDQVTRRLTGRDGLPGNKFSMTAIQNILFDNRNHAGELTVDALVAACRQTPVVNVDGAPTDLTRACGVLAQWDKKSNTDSAGAGLFREWWRTARATPNVWRTPFNVADPVNTPRDLNTADPTVRTALLASLARAVRLYDTRKLDYTAPLASMQFVGSGASRIPIHGGEEFEGVFNKMTALGFFDGAGYTPIASGGSYIQTVTFDANGPIADGILTYSQTTDATRPWFSDQTVRYAQKRWHRLPFTDDAIRADIVSTVVLVE